MEIIKYPQSCFMVKSDEKNILVDPGNLLFKSEFLDEWKKADFILITHSHGDHCFSDVLKEFNCPIYSTNEVKDRSGLDIKVVKSGDELDIEGIKIDVVDAKHGYMPWLTTFDAEINDGVGFIVEVEGKKIYFTSDTLCFKNDYKCDVLCAPVSAHGLVMGDFELVHFSKMVEANLVLPCHMENPKFPVDVEKMENVLSELDVNYKVLGIEDSVEI
ncbi:MAG: MBL fold metallo-hydrolase [Alphaproteobacteria bacterium]|nr:MBL fold metallo-hydrolase [Alphaproteobacteria bacterium]